MTQKTPLKKKLGRVAILITGILIGVGIVVMFVSNIEPPARIVAEERQLAVQAMELQPRDFVIQASGFGTAAPSQTFSAVSNVKGEVIFRHDDLESGAIISAGTLLVEIDPIIYQLALREANAEIASVEAEIGQLQQEAANADSLLALEQQRLDLSETSLERMRSLVNSGNAPEANLNTQLRATLAQRQAVQGLINQQSIIPIQLGRLDAQKERVLAKLAQVNNDLEDTKFFAPFDMRISDVSVEISQFVNLGQLLFGGDDIVASEVVLQVPMQSLRLVLNELPENLTDNDALSVEGIEAQVQLVGGGQSWPAQVVRIANGIDPATRTVRVVLRIEQPLGGHDLNTNPPLPKGMFVEGVLRAQMNETQLVLPQSAIHQGWVYVVNEESRLARVQIQTAFHQDDLAIISSGLEAGATIILDDVVPAISGMLLDAIIVDEASGQLIGTSQ